MKTLTGTVMSTKMQKTASVEVVYYWRHPVYKKAVKRRKKFLVHNDLGAKEQDKVVIQECRPISRRKRFKIIKIIK